MGQMKMEYDKVAWISLHPSKQQEYQNSRLSTTLQEIYNNANKKIQTCINNVIQWKQLTKQ